MLAQLRDAQGHIRVPGFYDAVRALSPFERAQFALHPFDAAAYQAALGVPALFGEAGYSPLEQRSARPTLEINGLTSGYQGAGGKTIVPAWARAKLTLRLVPDQEPGTMLALTVAYLKKLCPPTVRMEISTDAGGEPYLVSPESSRVQAALAALRQAFGCEPLLTREGGSIPIVNQFKHILKADSLLLGLGLPDDNMHAPNEKFNLKAFAKGALMSAHLWQTLPRAAEF
jgi:acetylornithine deacetylase/succinyl-diaminopimelate desuccinylase-like protein